MARDFDNSIRKAQKISITNSTSMLKTSIGGEDRLDFYRFDLTRRCSCNLAFTGLNAKIEATLLNGQGEEITQFKPIKKRKRELLGTLDSDTYYIRVSSRSLDRKIRYKLSFSAKKLLLSSSNIQISPHSQYDIVQNQIVTNVAPVILHNNNLRLRPGETSVITDSLLKVTALDRQPDEIVYTLISQPKHGRLELNGETLSRFTQGDLYARRY
jgi:hypothetical protein